MDERERGPEHDPERTPGWAAGRGSAIRPGRDRGVSTVLAYVLGLGITAMLIAGLMLSAGSFVQTQEERVIRTELNVVGEQVGAQLVETDRLVGAAEDGSVTVEVDLPASVAQRPYRIRIDNRTGSAPFTGGPRPFTYALVLSAEGGPTETTATIRTRTPIVEGVVSGGDLVVASRSGADDVIDELEVSPS